MNSINSKLNLKKGMLRIHHLILFGLMPLFTISYYFLFRIEPPIQEIKLKNGDILKVRPYIATNAEVINPEILNFKNSCEKLYGYQYNLDSCAKWNKLIIYLSKNNFSKNRLIEDTEFGKYLRIPIEDNNKLVKQICFYKNDGHLEFEYDGEYIAVVDWEFDSKNGLIKTKNNLFKIKEKNYNLTSEPFLWSKEKLIYAPKNNFLKVKYIAFRSKYEFHAILKINTSKSEELIKKSKTNIPFFYSNQIPTNFLNYKKSRFEWIKYFNRFYWNIDNSGKVYFIEPPFLEIIQFCSNSNKKYLTTPFYVLYSTFLIFLYLGIVHLVIWIISGFKTEVSIPKINDEM